MILAVIDIGSNTYNLKITDTQSGHVLHFDKLFVKMLEGSRGTSEISAAGHHRGLAALKHYAQAIKKYPGALAYAFATSAVRSSSNGVQFVADAERETGICINVIDGDQEALFITEGVKQAVELAEEPTLIMDIGGGSTEYVIANKNTVFWKKSYLLGASRLLETLQPGDPISSEGFERFENHLNDMLPDFLQAVQQYNPHLLIGSSGSFETLYNVAAHRFGRREILPDDRSLNFHLMEFETVYTDLLNMTTRQRLNVPGMPAPRAEMIHLSGMLIDYVLRKSVVSQFKISTYALKEGVVSSIFKNPEKWRKSLL